MQPTVTNTAIITAPNDTNPANNADDDVRTVVAASRDLYTDKTLSSGTALPGNDLTYRIYYRNYGSAHLPDTVITDTLPAGMTFVSASGDLTPTVTGNTVVWKLGTVPGYYAPGYSGYLYVTAHIPDDMPAGTVLRNRAEGTTSAAETGTYSNWDEYASTVQARTRDLRVYKSHYSGIPVGGSDITYRLRVYNDGNSPAANVRVTDTLPISATYVSWSGNSRFTLVSTADGQVVWTAAELPGSFSSNYIYLTVHLDEGLPSDVELVNRLGVSTSDAETDYSDNVTTHTLYSIAEGRDLKLTKSWSSGSPLPGNMLTYRLDYANLGTQSASNVVITDTLPLSTTFYSTYASGWSYVVSGRVITCTRSSLYGQSAGYINLTVYISDTVPTGTVLTNVAAIHSSDADVNPPNNVTTYTIPVASGSRDMYIDKGWYSGSAVPGGEITYRLYYRNYGSDPASNVVITDTLPNGLSYVSDSGAFTSTVVGNQVVWHPGTVPGQGHSGYYGYLYLTVRVGHTVPYGTLLFNVAEIVTADQETGFYSNLDTYGVTVQPATWVTADFIANPTSGDQPLMVVFTDTSVGVINTWLWDLGDGNSSNQQNPTHVYSSTGIYTVSLTISGPYGTDTLTRTNYITVYAPVQAGFTASPTSGVAPLTVVFTNTSTGDYTDSLWDFGDSVTSTLESPTHTYTAAGVYTVTLTASGPGGTDALTHTNYITVYEAVTADFCGSPASGPPPLTVGFTNLSTGDYDTCAWAFGDGSTSNDCNDPSHTYTAVGVYNVTLAVSGQGGADTLTRTNYITVVEGTQTIVDPTTGGTLVYTDTQGNPTVVQVPGGAVTETTTLLYTPVETTTVPSGFTFAGHAFDLGAYRSGTLLPSFTFSVPATITLYYSDADVDGLNEDALVLEYWDDSTSAWEDAACGSYDRHPDENWLAVPICHLSRFALFGEVEEEEPWHTIYLPVVLKNR